MKGDQYKRGGGWGAGEEMRGGNGVQGRGIGVGEGDGCRGRGWLSGVVNGLGWCRHQPLTQNLSKITSEPKCIHNYAQDHTTFEGHL